MDEDILQWQCESCTFLNTMDADKCNMCESARPVASYQMLNEIKRQKSVEEERQKQALKSLKSDPEPMFKQTSESWRESDFDDGGDWDAEGGDTAMEEKEKERLGEADTMTRADSDGWGDDGDWGDDDILQHGEAAMAEVKVPEKTDTFDIMNPRQLYEYQSEIIKSIQELLFVDDAEEVASLCRRYRWNRDKLTSDYLSNPEKVRKDVGLDSSKTQKPDTTSDPFMCFLCCGDVPLSQTFHLGCGHQYCQDCWSHYAQAEMEKGPKAIDTRCIEPKCRKILKPRDFDRFLTYKMKNKYHEYLLHSFVEGRRELAWCPGRDCTFCGKAEFGSAITIDCKCCHLWCFNCRIGAHLPCTCELAEKWNHLCQTDAENVTWIRGFTKQCVKCKSHIEKNQGCNHMTCRCGYEFCWLCRKEWKSVGGYGHKCNKPSEVAAQEQEEDRARNHLKRFMFYFSRHEAHEKSMEAAQKSMVNARECEKMFMSRRPDLKLHDVEFMTNAVHEIIATRRLLQWTYCYGYYMKDATTPKELFQTQQGLLESFADQLHEKAEKKLDDPEMHEQLLETHVRQELVSFTQTVAKYRKNLTAFLSDPDFKFELFNSK